MAARCIEVVYGTVTVTSVRTESVSNPSKVYRMDCASWLFTLKWSEHFFCFTGGANRLGISCALAAICHAHEANLYRLDLIPPQLQPAFFVATYVLLITLYVSTKKIGVITIFCGTSAFVIRNIYCKELIFTLNTVATFIFYAMQKHTIKKLLGSRICYSKTGSGSRKPSFRQQVLTTDMQFASSILPERGT